MKRLVTLGVTVATVAVITTTAWGGPAAAQQAGGGPAFGACPDDVTAANAELTCATVSVPLAYPSDQTGARLGIMLAKLPATDPAKRRGVLVVHPGGPGPGLTWFGLRTKRFAAQFARLRQSYDIIAFDQRGAGHSHAIRCLDDPASFWRLPVPDPDSESTRDRHWARVQQYSQECAGNARQMLPHMGTRDVARDMDEIRLALGQEKISFLGYSYASYLGAVYAHMFRGRVDRMLLDSVIDVTPQHLFYEVAKEQAVAAIPRRNQYFDWIAKYDSVFHLGTTRESVRAAWESVLADVRARPRGSLGSWEFLEASFNEGLSEADWKGFATALSKYVNDGDDTDLVDYAGEGQRELPANENGLAVFNAVTCVDAPSPTDRDAIEADISRVADRSPFGWWAFWFSVCAEWSVPAFTPTPITGRDLPPILMVNSELDQATPLDGARRTHARMPSSKMVIERSAGKHGVSILAGNACIDSYAFDYLLNGTLPTQDTSCGPHDLPDPTSAQVTTTDNAADLPRS